MIDVVHQSIGGLSVCVLTLSVFAVMPRPVVATIQKESPRSLSQLDANGVLEFFCQYALVIDRGIVHCPFGGATDNLVMENLKREEGSGPPPELDGQSVEGDIVECSDAAQVVRPEVGGDLERKRGCSSRDGGDGTSLAI